MAAALSVIYGVTVVGCWLLWVCFVCRYIYLQVSWRQDGMFGANSLLNITTYTSYTYFTMANKCPDTMDGSALFGRDDKWHDYHITFTPPFLSWTRIYFLLFFGSFVVSMCEFIFLIFFIVYMIFAHPQIGVWLSVVVVCVCVCVVCIRK